METLSNDNRRALMLGLLAVVIWSTVATAFKVSLRYLDVFQLLFLASSASALVLLIIVGKRGQLPLLAEYFGQSPRFYVLVTALNPCLYYLILLSAYDLLPAQQAQAINYTWAITLGLMGSFMLGQRLQWVDLVASVMGYGGVVIIATRGNFLSLQVDSLWGVTLALASTLVWAYYWIVNTRNQHDPVVSLCLNFALAAPVCLAICLLFSELPALNWRGLAAAAYVGCFEMGITFVLWSLALKKTSHVSRVANLIFVAPLLSLLPIHFVLGEDIVSATLLGLALIISASLLQQLQRSRA
jgi:drug/metabolite transporter (DMT)-like permease